MVAKHGLRPEKHNRQGQHFFALSRILHQQLDAERHSGSHLFETA